ncbi:MAG: NotI family restriction endonuclease [Pyrinomonadaceae bacterium]
MERKQIFTDCYHLLTLHEPGNELHKIGEVTIPGGSVDYVLISAKVNGGNRKVVDFVGIELQTLDTTGTVWPVRQRFLDKAGVPVDKEDVDSPKSYGMNWKMTAKTILVQLHHKIKTFEHVGKHFVLVMQDCLLDYMEREFDFTCIRPARNGDLMHFHAYALKQAKDHYYLELEARKSTDSDGISVCLGQKADPKVKLAEIVKTLESGLSNDTLLTV